MSEIEGGNRPSTLRLQTRETKHGAIAASYVEAFPLDVEDGAWLGRAPCVRGERVCGQNLDRASEVEELKARPGRKTAESVRDVQGASLEIRDALCLPDQRGLGLSTLFLRPCRNRTVLNTLECFDQKNGAQGGELWLEGGRSVFRFDCAVPLKEELRR